MRAVKRHRDGLLAPMMRSPAMRELSHVLDSVASKEVAITLIGESGTGKEVLARRIHEMSKRRKGPFLPINCAAIPEALFESELFGHERGAFTGAMERTKGKIEAAEGGTLFLDEVGEMPIAMQAKLLRFLENRRFMRVGGSTKLQANVRLVFATLRPLEDEIRAGRFRADLYYRIQGITLRIPPLRERRPDIVPLIDEFLAQLSIEHETKPPRLSRQARAAMLAHGWPGNVRELRNTVEMLCLLRGGRQVRVRDLPDALQRSAPAVEGSRESPGGLFSIRLDQPLARITEQVIEAVVAREHGNQVRAASALGISVRTIQRRIGRRAR